MGEPYILNPKPPALQSELRSPQRGPQDQLLPAMRRL